jgi:hypothetical protein
MLGVKNHSRCSDTVIDKIQAFIEKYNMKNMNGFEEPVIVSTTMSQIEQYGWPVTCPECGTVYCATRLHPRVPDRLVRPRCFNKSKHKNGKDIFCKSKNDVMDKFFSGQ